MNAIGWLYKLTKMVPRDRASTVRYANSQKNQKNINQSCRFLVNVTKTLSSPDLQLLAYHVTSPVVIPLLGAGGGVRGGGGRAGDGRDGGQAGASRPEEEGQRRPGPGPGRPQGL